MPKNSASSSVAIKFSNVSKVYQNSDVPALRGAGFEVKNGEFFCVVGPSGCGKSTVLKIIAGLEQPTAGEVSKPDAVSMVFQSGALLPWLTVAGNVFLVLEINLKDRDEVSRRGLEYLDMVGLLDLAEKYPRELSGGQRQRVGLARALAIQPKVLLLDEPFSALDTVTTDELHKDLLKIWEKTKTTIVMVSHSIEEAVSLADRIMFMRSGRVEEIFEVKMPYPRREQEMDFIQQVHRIRHAFLKQAN